MASGEPPAVEAHRRAAEAYPAIDVDLDSFTSVARRWSSRRAIDLADASSAGLAELYLAAALKARKPRAERELHRIVDTVCREALAPMHVGDAAAQDVRQRCIEKLLTEDGHGCIGIEGYAGDGRLGGLVRVMAIRIALDEARGDKRRKKREADLHALPPGSIEWELERLKTGYRQAFREAFASAIAALSPRDRNVLRLHHLGSMTVEQVGQVYGVHRGTVTRWITSIRASLLKTTRERLGERLALEGSELKSVMGLIQSQLDASVERLLASHGAQEPEHDSPADDEPRADGDT